ncbi:MAG: dTMP kinase [Candidatus Bathyarchaeia archaeon]
MVKATAGGKGMLIAIEGIDGSGKTTQAYLLVEGLRRLGYKAEYTTEPTHGRIGEIIRLHVSRAKGRAPVHEALLFAADRYEHVRMTIQPKLRQGIVVVSDRYLYSSLAYQGAAGRDLKWLREINFFAPKPHLTVYLDLPPSESLKRKTGERSVFEDLEYQSKVRKIYLDLAKTDGFKIVKADRSIEEIHGEILEIVLKEAERLMSLKPHNAQ